MGIYLTVIFIFVPISSNAQSLKQSGLDDLFTIKERPQLDSSINVNRLSSDECNLLIEKMYVVDQQYRDSLSRYWVDKTKRQYFGHLVFINDPANRTILMKILKRYGWPCDNDSRKLSTKAWHIAWHTRSNFDLLSEFYAYIIKMKTLSCVDPTQLNAIEEQIALVKRARNR